MTAAGPEAPGARWKDGLAQRQVLGPMPDPLRSQRSCCKSLRRTAAATIAGWAGHSVLDGASCGRVAMLASFAHSVPFWLPALPWLFDFGTNSSKHVSSCWYNCFLSPKFPRPSQRTDGWALTLILSNGTPRWSAKPFFVAVLGL